MMWTLHNPKQFLLSNVRDTKISQHFKVAQQKKFKLKTVVSGEPTLSWHVNLGML